MSLATFWSAHIMNVYMKERERERERERKRERERDILSLSLSFLPLALSLSHLLSLPPSLPSPSTCQPPATLPSSNIPVELDAHEYGLVWGPS